MDNQLSERDTREKKGQERERVKRVKERKKGREKMRERGGKRNGNQKELFEILLF